MTPELLPPAFLRTESAMNWFSAICRIRLGTTVGLLISSFTVTRGPSLTLVIGIIVMVSHLLLRPFRSRALRRQHRRQRLQARSTRRLPYVRQVQHQLASPDRSRRK